MTDGRDQQAESRIVVGVDGSEASKEALRWAARQAEMTGASVQAVSTWHLPSAAYGMAVPQLTGYDLAPAVEQTLRGAIKEALGEHPRVRVSAVVIEGMPSPTLLKTAVDADLLVVGSRGHGEFTGMLLGSVAQHCVSHAPCPVVIVRHRPPPAQGPAG
ncbi:MAG: universal stress protein, partial [Actinomycetota bacterium]|nr:universal stress protein [Actinomycetota bacterium]